jgi:uncharacterized SAM-binding protein YcdF (DUF218 family)
MARRARFRGRTRRFRPFRWLLRFTVFACCLWGAGFAVFILLVWTAAPPTPIPHADGIVVLTGGDNRVGTALALLAAGDAPALLIAAAATQYAGAITLGHAAVTTRGNAIETTEWARKRHMNSLLIVTADYHMPRALFVIGQRLPGITLTGVPVRPPAMDHVFSASTLHLLAAEYTKYLLARAGLDEFGGGDMAVDVNSP